MLECLVNTESKLMCKVVVAFFTVPPAFSGVPRNFVWVGGIQQIQLRTEDRENGDLGAEAP